MTHYVMFQWMALKIKGPEMAIDDAFRKLEPFAMSKDEVIDHFDSYDSLEVKRLT